MFCLYVIASFSVSIFVSARVPTSIGTTEVVCLRSLVITSYSPAEPLFSAPWSETPIVLPISTRTHGFPRHCEVLLSDEAELIAISEGVKSFP